MIYGGLFVLDTPAADTLFFRSCARAQHPAWCDAQGESGGGVAHARVNPVESSFGGSEKISEDLFILFWAVVLQSTVILTAVVTTTVK